jgi:hypothetical protein
MYLTLSATPCVKPKRLRGKTYFSANVQATRQQQKVIYILSIRWMDSTPFAQLPPSSSSKDDQPHQNYNFYQYIPIVLFLQGMSWCLSCLWLCHFTKGKLSKPCQELVYRCRAFIIIRRYHSSTILLSDFNFWTTYFQILNFLTTF